MEASAQSKHDVSIRLSDERWAHICEEHGELVGRKAEVLATIGVPDRIVAGQRGECLAVGQVEPGKFLVVVYREQDRDGLVITAFLTRRNRTLDRRPHLWP